MAESIVQPAQPVHVIGWQMVGSAYRGGWKIPGYTRVDFSDGTSKHFPEDVAIGPALDRCAAIGIDVADARAKLADWIATGQGVRFDLVD